MQKRVCATVAAGTKRPTVHHACVKESPLPKWFTNHTKGSFSCNTSMPTLKFIKEMLVDYIGSEDGLYVCRCGGVYCPVHLYNNSKYVHGSNGVYIGFKVYIMYYIIYKYISIVTVYIMIVCM